MPETAPPGSILIGDRLVPLPEGLFCLRVRRPWWQPAAWVPFAELVTHQETEGRDGVPLGGYVFLFGSRARAEQWARQAGAALGLPPKAEPIRIRQVKFPLARFISAEGHMFDITFPQGSLLRAASREEVEGGDPS